MRELALFAGAGGGILGSQLLGWHTVCAVEIDPYCRDVLLKRQSEGHLGEFPIWDDIRTFDAAAWRGHVDVITGGFPCQGISAAGKGLGLSDPRSGLVFEMFSIINEIRPRFVLAENSPNLRTKGLGPILSALASMGYDAKWGVLGAWHAGAPHRRNRLWIVATGANCAKLWGRQGWGRGAEGQNAPQSVKHGEKRDVADAEGLSQRKPSTAHDSKPGKWATRDVACRCGEHMADATSNGLAGRWKPEARVEKPQLERPGEYVRPWPVEPDVGRVAYGVARRVDRLRAIGNGQVPRVVELAWRVLSD